MLKMANWFKKGVIKEAQIAFKTNNIKKLDDIRQMGHDVSELLEFEEHPLLISIKNKNKPFIIYFIKLGITSELLENALILSKKEKLEDVEKLILMHTQKQEKRKDFYKNRYEKIKKQEAFILKNNI